MLCKGMWLKSYFLSNCVEMLEFLCVQFYHVLKRFCWSHFRKLFSIIVDR